VRPSWLKKVCRRIQCADCADCAHASDTESVVPPLPTEEEIRHPVPAVHSHDVRASNPPAMTSVTAFAVSMPRAVDAHNGGHFSHHGHTASVDAATYRAASRTTSAGATVTGAPAGQPGGHLHMVPGRPVVTEAAPWASPGTMRASTMSPGGLAQQLGLRQRRPTMPGAADRMNSFASNRSVSSNATNQPAAVVPLAPPNSLAELVRKIDTTDLYYDASHDIGCEPVHEDDHFRMFFARGFPYGQIIPGPQNREQSQTAAASAAATAAAAAAAATLSVPGLSSAAAGGGQRPSEVRFGSPPLPSGTFRPRHTRTGSGPAEFTPLLQPPVRGGIPVFSGGVSGADTTAPSSLAIGGMYSGPELSHSSFKRVTHAEATASMQQQQQTSTSQPSSATNQPQAPASEPLEKRPLLSAVGDAAASTAESHHGVTLAGGLESTGPSTGPTGGRSAQEVMIEMNSFTAQSLGDVGLESDLEEDQGEEDENTTKSFRQKLATLWDAGLKTLTVYIVLTAVIVVPGIVCHYEFPWRTIASAPVLTWSVWGLVVVYGFWGSGVTVDLLTALMLSKRKYMISETAVYVVWSLRQPVRVVIWHVVILVSWNVVFAVNPFASEDEPMLDRNKVTWLSNIILAMLVTVILVLVEQIAVTTMATRFERTAFFKPMADALWDEYMLIMLLNKPRALRKTDCVCSFVRSCGSSNTSAVQELVIEAEPYQESHHLRKKMPAWSCQIWTVVSLSATWRELENWRCV
jgi:hypothetical protein